jgi:hypothetical protein
MDDRILVYLDKERADHARSDYYRTVNRVQKIIDFLKSHEIECDIEHAQEIIENNDMAENFIKKQMPVHTESLPEAVRKLIDNNTDQVIKELNKIALDARESISNNCYHKVDYRKLEMMNDKVAISDEAFKECYDYGAVYIDTESRAKVYNCAQTALKALGNLQKSVDEAEKRGIMPGYHINGINRDILSYGSSILIVDEDGEVHLNGEIFQNIV